MNSYDMTRKSKENQAKRNYNPQRGNAFFIILLGIVLFAALSYAVTQSMRGGMSQITQEQAKFAAREMIEYGQKLRDTVKELMITNGCTDTQITFEGATYYFEGSGYTNATAPTSKICHVFDAAGGNMKFITPMQNVTSATFSMIIGEHCYEGVGTGPSPCPAASKELEFNVVNIPLSVCQEINKIAAIGAIGADPPLDDYNANTANKFVGTYSATDAASNNIIIGASGKNFGCYQDNAGTHQDQYIFYYILLAR